MKGSKPASAPIVEPAALAGDHQIDHAPLAAPVTCGYRGGSARAVLERRSRKAREAYVANLGELPAIAARGMLGGPTRIIALT